MNREVVFVEGVRTAIGRRGGALKDFLPTDLSALAVKGLLEKTKILEKAQVDSLFCGSAFGDLRSIGPARYTVLASGLPMETSASYVEMQCGSAIDSINHAAWKILAGQADIVIAGGMESCSQTYAKFSTCIAPYKGILPSPVPQKLAPTPDQDISMIQVSDGMAKKWGITRQECDEFAYRSQQRAFASQAKGYFKDEIIPVTIKGTRKTPDFCFNTDEHLRPETTLEGLSKLSAVLGPDGFTTAGNDPDSMMVLRLF